MFETFSEDARQVVVTAEDEARLLESDHVGSEHLVLGLLQLEADPAAAELGSAGLRPEAARQLLAGARRRGTSRQPRGAVSYTRHAKLILEQASKASAQLGSGVVTPTLLLRALLAYGDCLGFRMLRDLGGNIDALTRALDQLVRDTPARDAPAPRSAGGHVSSDPALDPLELQIAGLAAQLGAQRDVLGDALLRYGRHDAGCPAERGCTCGLAQALAALPKQ